jgi:hypothetical protein
MRVVEFGCHEELKITRIIQDLVSQSYFYGVTYLQEFLLQHRLKDWVNHLADVLQQ